MFHPLNVNFLDTIVYADKNGQLQTKLCKKSTDRHYYLAYKTNLLEHFKENCSELINNFVSRGYELEKMQNQVSNASTSSREQTQKPSDKEKSDRISFITTKNRTLQPM